MTVPIIMVDHHFWEASALFNPNAFPSRIRPEARTCGDRLAILTHSVEIVLSEPGLNRGRLLEQIRTHPSFVGFTPRADKPAVLVFHNLNFLSGLYSALVALKSLLDLYARLIAHLLVPKASVFGFNKAPYKGRKISGGRFLNWVERSAPTSFRNRDVLISLLLSHIDQWIDTAIGYRDAVVHDGFIRGMTEAMVPLDRESRQLSDREVLLPLMPNQMPVSEYCEHLVSFTRALLAETLF